MFECRYNQECFSCKQEIIPGSMMFPICEDENRLNRVWIHESCGKKNQQLLLPERKPFCKHWMKKGRCNLEEKCYFIHPKNVIPNQTPNTSGRRRKTKNDGRANVFRRWIIENYSDIPFQNGIILDVAAGKGHLSFLLSNLHGCESVALEPRNLNLSSYAKRFKYGMFHRGAKFQQTKLRDYNEDVIRVRHIPMVLTDHFVKCFDSGDKQQILHSIAQSQREAINTQYAIQDRKNSSDSNECVRVLYDVEEIYSTLQQVKLIVGLHPDAAAEPAIDFARILNVPFAVIPCCVFPKKFNRDRVKTYEDFIEYLSSKEDVYTEVLDFPGRNTCIYSLPKVSSG
eukprot:maker-scaffold_50-snap-gene-1.12-mRNA-1 protein AED:0.00 eAED:0.00 QI:102/1/1/1/1/1/3/276/340